jgi:hypothetical protein
MSFVASGASTLITLSGYQGKEYIGLENEDVEAASDTPEPSFAIGLLLIAGALILRKRSSRGKQASTSLEA